MPTATVSTPIRWDEVADVDPLELNIATVPTRFSELGDLHEGIDDEVFRIDELLEWADAIVVVTAHRAIDWARVYKRADLVVDTVDSSAGHRTRPRQVLRLGAGWSART